MSVSFLLQITRILHVGNYDDNELHMIYDYLTNIDNDELIAYHCTCSILSYNNDLELILEILDRIITIFEEKEEYEKCSDLQIKKFECIEITKQKTN
jgi:hypothetical protein